MRIIVENFLSSARLQGQPSLLHESVHAVISVIHEKVCGTIQREVSKKKLDSLTSVAAAHENQRPKLVDERDEVFAVYRFGGTRIITASDFMGQK